MPVGGEKEGWRGGARARPGAGRGTGGRVGCVLKKILALRFDQEWRES